MTKKTRITLLLMSSASLMLIITYIAFGFYLNSIIDKSKSESVTKVLSTDILSIDSIKNVESIKYKSTISNLKSDISSRDSIISKKSNDFIIFKKNYDSVRNKLNFYKEKSRSIPKDTL